MFHVETPWTSPRLNKLIVGRHALSTSFLLFTSQPIMV